MKEANGKAVRMPGGLVSGAFAQGEEDSVRRTSSYPREFLHHRFTYVVISPRAKGLSVGVNMNPDKRCQFNCIYCEVDRATGTNGPELDVAAMACELSKTLDYVRTGRLRELHAYRKVPDELLKLRHVALSGDGEPTLAPNFAEALQAAMHVRALSGLPFFKLVLITNAVALDLPHVQRGISHLTNDDEIWAKLDGGTAAYLSMVNGVPVPLDKILANILEIGRKRPVVIQSLFPLINGQEPPAQEIHEYASRLLELKTAGAKIELVQVYSATRPVLQSACGHLPLKALSNIAQLVRQVTGITAEVF
jgi:wyosine [tRNA(Phe)-imidazoG37] synthetase (radical SAM superfamily)